MFSPNTSRSMSARSRSAASPVIFASNEPSCAELTFTARAPRFLSSATADRMPTSDGLPTVSSPAALITTIRPSASRSATFDSSSLRTCSAVLSFACRSITAYLTPASILTGSIPVTAPSNSTSTM